MKEARNTVEGRQTESMHQFRLRQAAKKHGNCSKTPRLCCLISKNQISERCCAWGWVALTTPSCCDLDRSKRHRCHIGTKGDSHVRQVRIGRRYGREAAKNSIPRLDPSAIARTWQKGGCVLVGETNRARMRAAVASRGCARARGKKAAALAQTQREIEPKWS